MKPFDPKTPTVALGEPESELRRRLAAGEPIVFPDGDRNQRVIQAEWITNFDVPILVANAVIRGRFEEPYGEFKNVVMINCEFDGEVDLRSAKFAGMLNVSGSRFYRPVILAAADVADDLWLAGATFHSGFNARDTRVGQSLLGMGTAFHGATFFVRLKVDKAAFFTPQQRGTDIMPTRFFGDVYFIDAEFAATAEFDGSYFAAEANFTRVEVEAEAFFRRAGWANDADTYDRIPINDKQPAVIFAGDVAFRDANFKGLAEFHGAVFDGVADFIRMRVGSDALFAESTFNGSVGFHGATVGADFDLQRAKLPQLTEMYRMSVGGALNLRLAEAEKIDLRRSRIGALVLADDEHGTDSVEAKAIDCDGLQFDRFYGDWRRFLRLIEPFSRDPYDALERHLRAAGDESHARDVYFERRKRQGQELRKRRELRDIPRAFLLDPFERFISRYGVRSFGLFAATLILLFLGMFVFTRPGALEPKPPNAKKTPTREEAVVYSVALVIPLVQLPPIDRWRPSASPIRLPGPYTTISFETFSAIYRLAGFLFVPLAVAVVTGLLYRRDRN